MIICNKCGREIGATKVTTDFRYNTSKFDVNWVMHICDDCLLDIVADFKVVPYSFMQETSNIIITDEEEQIAFGMWQLTGTWDYLCGVPYEALITIADYHGVEYINEMIERYHPNESLIEVVN